MTAKEALKKAKEAQYDMVKILIGGVVSRGGTSLRLKTIGIELFDETIIKLESEGYHIGRIANQPFAIYWDHPKD